MFISLLAFTGGMASMGLEMTLSRLLTPYFGSSMYTWTNLIGIVMICLTGGYYLGGYLADRYASEKLLYTFVLAAGTYCFLLPCWAHHILGRMQYWVSDAPLSIFAVSFVANLLLISLPFMLLGTITPYLIQLSMHTIDKIGHTTGMLTACSTVGSIVGTFIPIFVAIPFLGTKKTIVYVGILLIVVALIGFVATFFSPPRQPAKEGEA
jgi:MFS family permease